MKKSLPKLNAETILEQLRDCQIRNHDLYNHTELSKEAAKAWQEDSQSKQKTIDELWGMLKDKKLWEVLDKVCVAAAAAAAGLVIGAAVSKYL